MTTYLMRIDDPEQARGEEPSLSFSGLTVASLAETLTTALRTPALFERWRALQDDPDDVDPELGAVDAAATAQGREEGGHHYLEVTTSLPHALLKHRLKLLIGMNWSLRDVR